MENASVKDFCEQLSEKAAIPGGGAAAAAGAAMGCGLGAMACRVTSGKKKFLAYEEALKDCIDQLDEKRAFFLALMQEDADAFLPLSKAYGLPAGTEEEKANKRIVMEVALARAADPPMKLIESAAEALELMRSAGGMCSRIIVSDIGVGASLLFAAAYSAALSVRANTELMKNREFANELDERAARLYSSAEACFEAVKGIIGKTE